MSRTGLSAADLAKSLRTKAGDGSVEWCHEPMQVSVLLDIADMLGETAKLREYVTKLEQANIVLDSDNTDLLCDMKDMQFFIAENAKLREQTELLVTLLRNDCDIEASWDGLRKFWYIGLTESGCLMRDRACKAEAENAKLRELVAELYQCSRQCGCDRCGYKDGCAMFDRMAQLGVEVNG